MEAMFSTPKASLPIKKEEKLTREVLEAHNIFYVENICEESSFKVPDHADQLLGFLDNWDTPGGLRSSLLPSHVYEVCKNLLQFNHFVPALENDASGVIAYLQDNAPFALDKSWACKKSDEDIIALEHSHKKLLRDHCRVATEASQLMFERDESSWQHFLDRELFCDPRRDIPWHSYEKSSSRCRRLTRVMGRRWNASDAIRRLKSESPAPSRPEPDITFGFRVWLSQANGSPEDETGVGKAIPATSNFSYRTLSKLSRTSKLYTMPLGMNEQEDLHSNYLFGFPFAIVEIKKSKAEKAAREKCICQAANAASTSLNIFEKLWDLANHTEDVIKDTGNVANDIEPIPPVVSFTCIGPRLRLWLGYSTKGVDNETGHVMVLIWEGDICTAWGVIQARKIYKNLSSWVLVHLRPCLSQMITKIRNDISASDEGYKALKTDPDAFGHGCETLRNDIAAPDHGYETLGSDDLLSEDGGDIFRRFVPGTPLGTKPKRPATPHCKTTPKSTRSVESGHLDIPPLDRPRARSAEPITPPQAPQWPFTTPDTATTFATYETPSPMTPMPNGRKASYFSERSDRKQLRVAESKSVADQFADMKLDRFPARYSAEDSLKPRKYIRPSIWLKPRKHIAARGNKAKLVKNDSDDEYYSAKESFEDSENLASSDTPTKNVRSGYHGQ